MSGAVKTAVRRPAAKRAYGQVARPAKLSNEQIAALHAMVAERVRVAAFAFEKLMSFSAADYLAEKPVEVAEAHLPMLADLRELVKRWHCPDDATLEQRRTYTATRVLNIMMSSIPRKGGPANKTYIASYSRADNAMVAKLRTFAEKWFAPVRTKQSTHHLSPKDKRVFHAAWNCEPSERTTTR